MKKLLSLLLFSTLSQAVIGPFPGSNSSSSSGGSSGGSGTVTSVGLTMPSIFSVAGSPVTTAGTLAVSYSGTALPIANGGTGLTAVPGSNTQFIFNSSSAYGATTGVTYNSTTRAVTIAPTGSNPTGFQVDMSGATGPFDAPVQLVMTYASSGTSRGYLVTATGGSGSGGGNGYRADISGGSTSSGTIRGYYASVNTPVSGQSLRPTNAPSGNMGFSSFVRTAGVNTGGAIAVTGHAGSQNLGIGGNFFVDSGIGASAKSYAIRGLASAQTDSGTARAVALYAKINTTGGDGLESAEPSSSAAAYFDNGDTTSPILDLRDDNVQVVSVVNGGTLNLHTNASLATAADLVQLGGYDIAAGQRTLALATEEAVASDAALVSTHSLQVRINGTTYKILLATP